MAHDTTSHGDEMRGDFRFAQHYNPHELVGNPVSRRSFFEDFLRRESCFMRPGIGIAEGGLTFDGTHIGDGHILTPRTQSNPSKEALHIALLALAVSCDGLPRVLFPANEALQQLERKADALEAYRAKFPHLHGFMAWFDASTGGAPLEPDIAMRYNGMLGWALYFAVHALREFGHASLAQRFAAHLEDMRKWAVRFSYKGRGKIAARATLRPRQESPLQSEQNCDDPFAGELFSLFLDLLADWGEHPRDERDHIWTDADRRRWVQPAFLSLGSDGVETEASLEVMLHGTFSVHEEWKHLLLPYLAVPVSRRLLMSAEKARCRYAKAHGLPGLLGDCHVPRDWHGSTGETQHVTCFGIPGVSRLRAEDARCDAVAGCGAFGLLLIEPAAGSAWLHSTLLASEGMQTPWGIAESCRADGAASCPLLTWDGKATTALAVLGGLGPRMKRYLDNDGLLARFAAIIEGVYADFASQALEGELAGLPLPIGAETAGSAEDVDLEMVRACRCVELPAADAWQLCRVREWFEDHQTADDGAPYCIPRGFEDWCTTGGRYCADEVGREALYSHILTMFDLGVPLVLLIRQPPLYPLFFDLDIYGGMMGENGADKVCQLAWDNDEKVLVCSIVLAVLKLYPQLSSSLQLAVFGSSGPCRSNGRYKASYHFVFPQIIVDRPVKPWPNGPCGQTSGVPGRHMAVRDHVVCCLTEESAEGGCLSGLREELFHCCNALVEDDDEETSCGGSTEGSTEFDPAVDEAGVDSGSLTYLNDWTEVLDDKPLRHEPWPEAATGFRLPFTDKAENGKLEGRPKVPLGLWEFRAEPHSLCTVAGLQAKRLADPEPAAWIRLGDLASCDAEVPTPWDQSALHAGAREALQQERGG